MTTRVLHVLSSSGLGGTEVSTLRLATETRAALATEFCLLASPGPISEEIERAGFACRHIPIASPASAIRALPALFRLLRRSDVEVVQTYGMRAHLLVRLVGRLAGRRCIVGGLRSLEGTSDRGRPWLWLDRLTFGLSRGYISNSDAALERFAGRGYPRSRLWRIHNGIDLDEFRPATEDERAAARRDLGIDSRLTVLTCVANLRPIKNHRTLVRALELIDGDAVLLLIGDGPLRAELEAQVASADLERHVRFVGRVDTAQLPTWLGATDVCVLASDAEGLPTSLLEAMASGVPVIATAVGGVPEIVADGETGVLVPPRDEIRLAQAIGRLVADREARERMGRAGRERAVRQFGLVQMAEAYVALYRQLLASSSTGRALRRRSGSRKIPAPEENGARRDRS